MDKVKLVIFDIDGTLLDSEQDVTDAMNKTLLRHGYPPITSKEMKSFLGADAEGITRLSIKKELKDDEIKELTNEFLDIYVEGKSPKTKPFEDIPEVLKSLKDRGYILCAVSNKQEEEIAPLKERLLLPLGIEEVLGLSSKIPPKPNPYGANLMMQKFGANPKDVYFIGDGETDVLTAINGGMNCVAVLWGNRGRAELEKVGAKVFANKPTDLLDIIK